MHEKNCFLTLTYDEENVPEDRGLVKKDWQNFAKKVRNRLGPFRFMHCGEYGDESLRPHYHALIFGQAFEDSVPLTPAARGKYSLRVSADLAEMWTGGFHTIGSVTFDSAAYVASYVTKKVILSDAGDYASEHQYDRVDPETGECWQVAPEYATMSRGGTGGQGGLGKKWFEKFWEDVYPDNFVVMNGKKFKPPGYYDDLLKKKDEALWKKMLEQRKREVRKDEWDYTEDRLRVKEKVLRAQIAQNSGII